jgi:hypothetical protein
MNQPTLDVEFVKLALALNEHIPGYVDAYVGPEEWAQEATQAGKRPLVELEERVNQLVGAISQVKGWDPQRKDYLACHVNAMQMSLRLLAGQQMSLAEETEGLYDIHPAWKDESHFLEAQRLLDQALPAGESLQERMDDWKRSLEIPVEKAKELLPWVSDQLRQWTRQKFSLPEGETFEVDFVSDQPWMAYNWFQGGYRSRIEINADLPSYITELAELMAHEGYPGHHTEHCIKESKLVRQMKYMEQAVTILYSPSCVIAEGIATLALEALLGDQKLEDWYREEVLPRAGMTHIDAGRIVEVRRADRKMDGLWGNGAFMLHDQHKSPEEVSSYLQRYGLHTDLEAEHALRFLSDPLSRSYTFTYFAGHDMLNALFAKTDRGAYFKRLLEEPVTPNQLRQWINNESYH